MISLNLLAAIFAFGLGLYIYLCSKGRRPYSNLPLPPGPKKLPLIGNLLNMPKSSEWLTYLRWGKEFNSDIIHLDVAGTSLIVVNTAEAATDLFDRRSSLYSSRAILPMVNGLMGWNFDFAFVPYGDQWRRQRRIFHQEFNYKASQRWRSIEKKATNGLLSKLLATPEDFLTHLRQMAGETIMSIAYGIDVQPKNDPFIAAAEETVHALVKAILPGAFLVDVLPVLQYLPEWFPGAGFKKQARLWRETLEMMVDVPFQVVKRNISEGVARMSYASRSLNKLKGNKDLAQQERDIQCTAAVIYAAGSDTTVAALGFFILGMLANPEAQAKAQAELDAVVGRGRLPEFSDQDSLPYLTAIVKEVLRWKSVLPMAVPHLLTTEDVYAGYRLPAGSIVIGNTWAILHDEVTYPDPHSFKPERFLKDGKLDPTVKDPATAAFGFGRRICPGRHMAMEAIWIAAASILSSFNISKAVAEDGSVIEPTYDYTVGLVAYPVPFKCSIKPRSEEAMSAIRQAANAE